MIGTHKRRWRLAVCLSHPIQYKVPLLRRLAAQPAIGLTVYYYSNTGLVERPHPDHGTTARWDVPLLDGYEYEFLPNRWPAGWGHSSGIGPYLNPALVSRLSQARYDAVMIHSYVSPSDWLAWLAARLRRTPVLFYGDLYPSSGRPAAKKLGRHALASAMLRGSAACLAIGSVAAEVYRDYHVPEERVFSAPYAVDNDFFVAESVRWREHRLELRAELGIPAHVSVVLCVAGMRPEKRQTDLVEAIARVKVPTQLVLVGQGPLYEQVRAYCQQRLPGTILTGFKNQSELPRYYALADVFVLPSLWDPFGLVVNEAMCAALPVIASHAVAAGRDLVRTGENGYVFPPGDVDALAACLTPLLTDAELRRQFGQRSLEIISGWSYEQTVEGILAALEYASQGTRSASLPV
jgi:glycosyltransferase involved in cell wall biosynthesis